jgi:hypothetical protein
VVSSEIYFDAFDVQIRNVDVSRLRRQAARIDTRAAMMEFVAATVGQWKSAISLADACEICRQIGQMVGHEMDNLALALDATLHGDHAGRQDDAPLAFVQGWPDHQVGDAGLVVDG